MTPKNDRPKPDIDTVAQASKLLDLSEYQFFGLAYHRWFGETPTPSALDQAFKSYLKRESEPAWVRHAVRDVMTQHRNGTLDPRQLGVRASASIGEEDAVQRAAKVAGPLLWAVIIGLIAVGIYQ